ncbi:MAG: superoxide dismutase family protein [Acutalibacteraceae bacterium]
MNNRNCFYRPCADPAEAVAFLEGSETYPSVSGTVRFFRAENGVMVRSEICGLPTGNGGCDSPIFAFHIHDGEECTGDEKDPFANAKGHYNPESCPHPYHAGDMPPLFGANGKAFSCFLTDRFQIKDILGKVVIIHRMPDDFMTQPSGNAGEKIACGVIRQAKRRQ